MTGASGPPDVRPAPVPPRSAPRYCSVCGSERIELRVPDGDNLPRHVCAACLTIHYQNPKIVVGCLPEFGEQVLLCLRAIEPRRGLWTLPAGFLENGETLAAGAMRETLEEANARVAIGPLYTVISLPHIGQVYMMFRSRLADCEFGPGPESLEVRLFGEDEIPWEQLAFRTIGRTLRNYFLDRKLGAFGTHVSALERKRPRPDLSGAG
jgi:ADP-ribose pyrophosphatase YjhB (NUDIX family)